ncbi:MAG: DUF2141 domain-containing protein [Bacteroidota bacterium]
MLAPLTEKTTLKLTVKFENVKYSEGQLLVGFYKDQDSWSRRTPFKEVLVSKAALQDGNLVFELGDMPPGRYGLAVLDDANGNEIVDFGLVFPKEGFGFSDYYHNSFRLPRFSDFVFDMETDKIVTVKFRYLKGL